jgi:hypothetical protein
LSDASPDPEFPPPTAALVALIERGRWPLAAGEKAVQAALADAFAAAGLAAAREARLGPGEVIDFLVGEGGGEAGIGVEVKMNGAAAAAVRRQLARYAATGRCAALVLATNRALALPPALAGVPLAVASLGRGWL